MNKEDKARIDKLLAHAQELLSRDLKTWRPPLYTRIRWWNLAFYLLIIGAILAVVLPLIYPKYRNGFSGNLISSAWQLIAGAIIGWIAYRRFKAERFHHVMPIDWDKPFEVMSRTSLGLYPAAIQEDPIELRTAITPEIRRTLRKMLVQAHRKVDIYGRFLEIEQLTYIDRCCDAAEALSRIDERLPDPIFMKNALDSIRDLYVWSEVIRGYRASGRIVKPLNAAIERWFATVQKSPSAHAISPHI